MAHVLLHFVAKISLRMFVYDSADNFLVYRRSFLVKSLLPLSVELLTEYKMEKRICIMSHEMEDMQAKFCIISLVRVHSDIDCL